MFVHNSRRQQLSSLNKPSTQPPSTTNKKPFGIQDENVQQLLVKEPKQKITFEQTFTSISQCESTHEPPPMLFENSGSDNGFDTLFARAIAIDPSKRILCYKPSAPYPRVNIRINAQQPTLNTQPSHVDRHISIFSEKTLDTPYLADDFYTNVLDWSKTNILAVALDKSVYLWDANSGAVQPLMYDTNEQVASLSWSNDGSFLALGTTAGDTQIWDVQANKKIRTMTGQSYRIGAIGWNKYSISTGAYNGSVFTHDVRLENHVVRELLGHAGEVCGLKYRWDGELATGGNDNALNIWDQRSSKPKHQKRQHQGAVKALSWCPWNHSTLASGGGRDDGAIHFWNASTGLRQNTIHTNSQVTSLAWSAHYQEIASTHGYPYNQVSLWSYPTLQKIIDIPAHDSRILHSALSPDGQVLATAAADQNLKFWRIFEANGQPRLTNQRLTQKGRQLRTSKSLLR